jgi:ABC-2 type transport system ATP-binding protein
LTLAIRTEGLAKRYGGLDAVKGLNLAVPAGSIYGFLGPNGAGKTTTIMMLLGNVRPTTGRGWLLGRAVGDREVRRRVGFLPERFQFHDFLTATELLRFHGRLAGLNGRSLARRVAEALERVGLAERARSRIREFSKGMQQRLGLAQAILHQPELVILDEPTSALDPLGRREVRDLIGELRDRGTTVFVNSHLLAEIERTCDEVAILRRGEVVAQGPVAGLLNFSSRVDLEVRAGTTATWERLGRLAPRIERQGDRVTAWVEREEDVPALARAVVETGAQLMALQPHRESLEDLFVRLTAPDGAPG